MAFERGEPEEMFLLMAKKLLKKPGFFESFLKKPGF